MAAPLNRGMITTSIMLATIMQVVDMTIVNVALPHMQGSMSATQDQVSWVLTSYIVASAIMTPLTGVLAAKLGRRRLFILSVVGFALTSMLCGAATSLEQMVLYRVLQGAFGAPLVPLSQAVLLDTYPREKHGSAMALWGMGVMVGPILGPTLGGYLTEYYTWRWAFYFCAGLVLMFVVGVMLLATLALLPPLLQNLLGFPVLVAGYLLAPRGIGTMVAMLVVGRLIGKVDTRWLLLTGLALMAVSLWEMTQFTLDVGVWPIVRSGIVQGVGLGFIFVPLSTAAFATMAPQYRNEAASMFSLIRNISSSIGISLVVTILGREAQTAHAELGSLLTPFRDALRAPWLPQAWDWTTSAGAAALNAEVSRQALMIAYVNDFRFMMFLALLAAPLLLLLRATRKPTAAN